MTRVFAMIMALGLAAAGAAVAQQEATETGTGATLRGLDKLTGKVTDIQLASGDSTQFGRIEIALGECRYPEGDRAGDAFAFVHVQNLGAETPVFSGWMIASSPALSALEHPRYDVWVTRCTTSS